VLPLFVTNSQQQKQQCPSTAAIEDK